MDQRTPLRRSLWSTAVGAAVVWASLVQVVAAQDEAWVIPPGQDGVVLQMIGREVAGCTASNISVAADHVAVTFSCEGVERPLRLVHRDAAEEGARRTENFGIAGDAPEALLDALVRQISEHEADFRWVRPTEGERTFPTLGPGEVPSGPQGSSEREAAYAAGLELYRAEDYDAALEAYMELAHEDPHGGVLGMVVASLASGHPSRLRVDDLAQAADASDGDEAHRALANFMAGVGAHYYAHQSGRDEAEKRRYYERAIEYLERIRPVYDFEPRLFIYLAVSHFRLGEQAPAEALIEQAVELGSEDPDAFYCRAEIFQRVNIERSIEDLERYLEMTDALRDRGAVGSDEKRQRVREMLEHLRAVQRGERDPTELFDPIGAGAVAVTDAGASPTTFALAALAIALLAGIGWWIAARRKRRAGASAK